MYRLKAFIKSFFVKWADAIWSYEKSKLEIKWLKLEKRSFSRNEKAFYRELLYKMSRRRLDYTKSGEIEIIS